MAPRLFTENTRHISLPENNESTSHLPQYSGHDNAYDRQRIRPRFYETRLGNDWDRGRRTKIIAEKAIICATAPFIIATSVGLDIREDYERITSSHSVIHEIDAAFNPEDNDTLAVGFVGFGASSADSMMEHLQSLKQIAQTAAENYSDQGISTDVMAEDIIAYAQPRGVKRIIAVGHSIGGLIAANTAVKLQKIIKEKQLKMYVSNLVMFQTPYSVDSVRSSMRSFGDDVCKYAQYAPWLKHWWPMRFTPVFLSQKNRYVNEGTLDIEKSVQTAADVYERQIRRPNASTNLLYDQYCTQLGAGGSRAVGGLEKGSNIKIDYYSPRDATSDSVVNEDHAYPAFKKRAEEQEIQIDRWQLPNIGHRSPGQEPEAFDSALNRSLILEVKSVKQREKRVQECIDIARSSAASRDICEELVADSQP